MTLELNEPERADAEHHEKGEDLQGKEDDRRRANALRLLRGLRRLSLDRLARRWHLSPF